MNQPVRIGNCLLYLGDCRDVMPSLGQVDAIVTDPPYGISYRPGTRSTKSNDLYAGGAYHTNFDRVVGDDRPFHPSQFLCKETIMWGANNYSRDLPNSKGWLCWHKSGGIKGFRMSECELAWTNILTSNRHFSYLWHGFKRDGEVGEKVYHPTQKPVALMEWCLGFIKSPLAIDPFMGAGSAGIASIRLGRSFIGVEIDPDHFATACKRIELAYRQRDLFIAQGVPVEPKQEALL